MKPTVCWETYDRHDDDNVLHVKRMSNCHAQSLVFDPTCQCGRVPFLSRLAVLWSSIRSANRWTAKCQPHSTSTDRLRFVLLFFYLPPRPKLFFCFFLASLLFLSFSTWLPVVMVVDTSREFSRRPEALAFGHFLVIIGFLCWHVGAVEVVRIRSRD